MDKVRWKLGEKKMQNEEKIMESVISIASELFRFRKVFEKVLTKIDYDDQKKYLSQYEWFNKKVEKALNDLDLRLVSMENQKYDPGIAVIPLNIDDFEPEDELMIEQMIEPIVMKDNTVIKTGIAILRRIKK